MLCVLCVSVFVRVCVCVCVCVCSVYDVYVVYVCMEAGVYDLIGGAPHPKHGSLLHVVSADQLRSQILLDFDQFLLQQCASIYVWRDTTG